MRSLHLRLHLLWIGRFLRDSVESEVLPGSAMVGGGGSSSVGIFSGSDQPSPRLLVRLLGRGVGSSSSGSAVLLGLYDCLPRVTLEYWRFGS